VGLNKLNMIIRLGPKGQPTFVEEGGPTQVGQAGLCELNPLRPIYLFIPTQSCIFFRIVYMFTVLCFFITVMTFHLAYVLNRCDSIYK
jgi:hypothetical protein